MLLIQAAFFGSQFVLDLTVVLSVLGMARKAALRVRRNECLPPGSQRHFVREAQLSQAHQLMGLV